MPLNREQLLKLLRRRQAPLSLQEIVRLLALRPSEVLRLRRLIGDLVAEGELVRQGEGKVVLATGQGKRLTGRISLHVDGYGFLAIDGGGDDIFLPARELRGVMQGDRLEIELARGRQGRVSGRLIAIQERGVSTLVGRLVRGNRGLYVIPRDQRLGQSFLVTAFEGGEPREGELVEFAITLYPTPARLGEGRIVRLLGPAGTLSAEILAIISSHGLADTFTDELLKEAKQLARPVADADLLDREDLRHLPMVTIDGETARDFDDAVAIEELPAGGFRLWVAIADVSHYVRPGTPLDKEALARSTSVYFPDRALPMLPEPLSNGICSLNPHEDRLTVTAELFFDGDGNRQSARFYPSVIKSRARLTYTLVKKVVEDGEQQLDGVPGELIAQLLIMKALAARLTERRRLRGSIDFDLPEPQVVLDLTGEAENIIRSERNLAHRLIEEFMLAANEAVAQFITDQGVPSLYRIHEPPDGERMAEVILFLRPFGFELPHHAEGIRPAELQKILASAVGRPEERLVHELILRSLKQARYAVQNSGHFGLAADCYTHFTSPIRRYPDLVIHRIVKGIVANSLGEGERRQLKEELPGVAEQTSRRERVAMEAEREVLEFMRLRFMERHIGEEHDGIVVGVGSVGLYVELITYYVEGLVLLESLDDDTYIFEEGVHGVVGSHTGRLLRLGDRVRVRVSEVSWERRRLLLKLLAGGMLTAPTYVPRRPASRAKRRR